MKQTIKGDQQGVSTPRPMTIFLQPGQVLTIIAADGSGRVPRSALAAGFPAGTIIDPDDTSPSASKDRSGR